MMDNVSWGIAFSENSYTLQRNGITSTSNLPNDDSSTHNLQEGVVASSSSVAFDNFGSPGGEGLLLRFLPEVILSKRVR